MLEEFDIHSKDARERAEAVWKEMRDTPGLAYLAGYGGLHVASRYEDVLSVLTRPSDYSSARGITVPAAKVRSPHIPAEVDPPEHRDYRALLTNFLTPQAVREMEPTVRTIVRQLLDRVGEQTHFDFYKAVARPLPVYASLALLSLPESDAELLDHLVEELHHEVATGAATGAAARLTSYVEETVSTLRHDLVADRGDLMSSIILGEVCGRRLELHEQVSIVRLLLIGGFDTTGIALATAVWWLAQHPEDVERLQRDPKVMSPALEEFVRYASPATYLRREVTAATEMSGCPLARGDQVLVAFGSANRDERKFADPNSVILDRKPNPHLGFGAGHHRCVGSFFAKLEMRVALEEIFRRYSSFALDPDGCIRLSSGLNQGIMSLPMIFEPRSPIGAE